MPPVMRGVRRKMKAMDRIQLTEYAMLVMIVIIALVAIVVAVVLSNWGDTTVKQTNDIRWSKDYPPIGPPLLDTDKDGLSDIEENYKWGTNLSSPDTDGDGMPDGWEVSYGMKMHGRDPRTGEWQIDPNDPTDAYEDPDNDGYDYDHNGYIDGSEQDRTYSGYDWVYLSKLKVPAHSDYTTYNLNQLLSNQEEHRGELVRITGARVVDNGTYDEAGTTIDREINISITDESTNQMLTVLLEPRGNRPLNLNDDAMLTIPADIVDVQGLFRRQEGPGKTELDWEIAIRGTEKFTNLMEFMAARDYDGDGNVNSTDPLQWDTDNDVMSDGWEVQYGEGFIDTTLEIPKWKWVVPLDPTYDGDAFGEDPRCDLDNDRIQWPDPVTQELKWVGYNRDEYITIREAEMFTLFPPSRRNLADILGMEDVPRSWYFYGMNPNMPDTDMDSYDVDNDGYTPGVDTNTNDFSEVFVYGTEPTNRDTDGDTMWDGWEVIYALNATNPNDRFDDSDGDLLQNYEEFQYRTNPRHWDTDDEGALRKNPLAIFDDPLDPACFDGMPDGWEVYHGLDPLFRGDWNHDDDVIDIAGMPVARADGLINLLEFYNNTDPKNPDTDGDHLSDYEEVAVGWDIKVNGKPEHYFTCASRHSGMDTDKDTQLGPPLGDGSPPGPTGTEFLSPGDPDTRHDMNDWNEIVYYHTNASNPDSDGEGLSDPMEVFLDRDPDTSGLQTTDPTLADTDGDGLNDYVEVTGLKLHLPGSAVQQIVMSNPLRMDSDNDGLKDGDEIMYDFLPKDVSGKSQVTIRLIQDTDGYFYPGYDPDIQKQVSSCNPRDPDTDHDGLPDGYEFDNSDSDADGLPTWWELEFGFGRLNPFKQDTDDNGLMDMEEDFDSDGFNSLEEFRHRTDPTDSDSPIPGLERPPGVANPKSLAHNGVKDSNEGGLGTDKSQPFRDQWGHPILLRQPIYSDSDGDRMPDWWEIIHNLNARANDAWDDKDSDGFFNLDEYIYGTDPEVADTNHNTIPDWKDHAFCYNKYAVDKDGNGVADWWEKYYFGGPCDPNANPDGPWDPDNGILGDNWTNFQEWYNSPAGWENNLFRTNPLVNDTDGDFINDDADPNPVRIPYISTPMYSVDPGATMNPVLPDTGEGDMDHDGMSNVEEYKFPFGTMDPTDPDSDSDGMTDGWEVAQGRPLWNYTFENDTGNQTGGPNRLLDPLDGAGDTLADADIDGVNYSLKWFDYNDNDVPDSGEFFITEYDANMDGVIDPFFENESFSNLEEYWFGKDCDADGIMENTSYPWHNDSDQDFILDGFEVGFADNDDDGMPNLYEMRYGLNPLDPTGVNGSDGDPDGDGYPNLQEYQNHSRNPRDPMEHPGMEGRGGPARLDPNNLPADYEVACMVEKWLLAHPRAYDGQFLRDVQAYLWNYRKDIY